jgi:hypothetical protein
VRDVLAAQRAILADVLLGEHRSGDLWKPGAISGDEILDAHRQTVFGALTNALELIFPTVLRVVGTDFFTQVAHHYIAFDPPRSPILSLYGANFPEYIGKDEHCAHLTYLRDVASFDLTIDRVAHHAPGQFDAPLRLSPNVDLRLDRSLHCLAVDYPVDAIRDAIEGGREDSLSSLDMDPITRYFAVWMGTEGVRVRPVGETAYVFIVTRGGATAEPSVTAKIPPIETKELVDAIRREVIWAPYSQISVHATD